MALERWEYVDADKMAVRLHVHGGWLVATETSDGDEFFLSGIAFMPDAAHEWVLANADEEPTDEAPTDEEPTDEEPPVLPPVEPPPDAPAGEERIPVFDDDLRSSFRNFSWAQVDLKHADAYKGSAAILIEPDRYAALNLQLASGIDVALYEGVDLHIKAMGDGAQQVQLAFAAGQTVLAQASINAKFPSGVLPVDGFAHVRITFDEAGLLVGTFDSLLVQGTTPTDQSAVIVDEVYLVKRATPRVSQMPSEDPAPVPPVDGWLYTQGNRILNAVAEQVQFRGVNIHDTRSNNSGAYNPPVVANVLRLIDEAEAWGANFVRLCMESYGAAGGRVHWQGVLDDAQYFEDIKTIVAYATGKGMYIETALWVDPTQNTLGWPTDATLPIIAKLTSAMRDNAKWMIGFCNEPQQNYDNARSADYAAMVAKCIQTVRDVEGAGGHRHLVCVQAPSGWARYLDYFVRNPLQGTNIVYECHVYDSADEFMRMVNTPAQALPMFVGEFAIFQASYGQMTGYDCRTLVETCNRLGVGWCGWAFHHSSPPSMLQTNANQIAASGIAIGQAVPTTWGALMKELLGASRS